MFTGIVETTGQVLSISEGLTIDGTSLLDFDVRTGDSIAVNGACLTATPKSRFAERCLHFDVGPTTLALTQLGDLRPGHSVNLERAMRLDQRLGGHLVTGHIDGTATVTNVEPQEDFHYLHIRVPAELARYMITRGSCCLNGVSLTIAGLVEVSEGALVTFMLIPETWNRTNLATCRVGSKLNVEVDTLAKWVERLTKTSSASPSRDKAP